MYILSMRMRPITIILLMCISACSFHSKQQTVENIALASTFAKRSILSSPFLLTSYEHVQRKGGAAQVYIEGDGQAWLSKRTASLDPTPNNPIALKLAALDGADNVFYLARPCQYSKMIDETLCEQEYWTSHRFAPEVIDAMNVALDDMKQRHSISKFHLIGFSGGGNVAALLAARRDDISSLRTVAGNLNHALQSKLHAVSPMPESLNAKDIAHHISHIPQIHFVGALDEVVPQSITQSYKSAAGASPCVQSLLVPNVGHAEGWESQWPMLLKHAVDCTGK